MNVQKRRQVKQRKAQKTTREKTQKKQKEKLTDVAKSAATTLLIWALVIFNLFIIASFVSKFWGAPGGNEVAFTKDGEIPVQSLPVKKIQVEVLNGCGVPGIAKTITEYLREKGYDVVKVDNYESFNVSETMVIDRRSLDKTNAIQVAKIMGVASDKGVAPFLNQELLLDVSIVIGHDYKNLTPFKIK
jgi:hypothetical protein